MVFKTGTGPNKSLHYYTGQEKDPLSLLNEQYNADNDTSFQQSPSPQKPYIPDTPIRQET
jgi:hypothetical protein